MTYNKFIDQSNIMYKCIAHYKDKTTGDSLSGLIIEGTDIHTSTLDEPYIYVNNFVTRVYLSDISSIQVTNQEWSNPCNVIY